MTRALAATNALRSINTDDLRPGDVVIYDGQEHPITRVERRDGWAGPIASDGTGWAIALPHGCVQKSPRLIGRADLDIGYATAQREQRPGGRPVREGASDAPTSSSCGFVGVRRGCHGGRLGAAAGRDARARGRHPDPHPATGAGRHPAQERRVVLPELNQLVPGLATNPAQLFGLHTLFEQLAGMRPLATSSSDLTSLDVDGFTFDAVSASDAEPGHPDVRPGDRQGRPGRARCDRRRRAAVRRRGRPPRDDAGHHDQGPVRQQRRCRRRVRPDRPARARHHGVARRGPRRDAPLRLRRCPGHGDLPRRLDGVAATDRSRQLRATRRSTSCSRPTSAT